MSKDIFYAPDIKSTSVLPIDESNHCVKVMRKKAGDQILVTDGCGYFYLSEIVNPNPKTCEVRILETIPENKGWNFNLSIAFAPTKNMDRIEWFIEKATEIGIDEFTPILCDNSERKVLKSERLDKIIIAACKQSQKANFPKLNGFTSFNDFLTRPFEGTKYMAHCHDTDRLILPHIYKKNQSVLILIGPEGDFSKDEVIKAEVNDFQSISLIDSRLRTETAALFACSMIQVLNM